MLIGDEDHFEIINWLKSLFIKWKKKKTFSETVTNFSGFISAKKAFA